MKNRMTLGFRADAAETAALTMVDPSSTRRIYSGLDGKPKSSRKSGHMSKQQMVKAVVERVRRKFRKKGNKYAKVAYAILMHRPWGMTGIPRRTFFHAKKKIEDFLEACKHEAKSMSRQSRREKKLH